MCGWGHQQRFWTDLFIEALLVGYAHFGLQNTNKGSEATRHKLQATSCTLHQILDSNF
jgi:hypothetical protein